MNPPSIYTATEGLPANVRGYILWQFGAVGLEDDGHGYLDRYLQAINSRWTAMVTRLNELQQSMNGIHTLSAPPRIRAAVMVEATLLIEGQKTLGDASG